MLRAFRGIAPKVAASAYIDPSAQVIGDVVIGERASVWCHVTIRGDVHYIRVGDDSSVQDNTVIHVELDTWPALIGRRVTVGHSVTLHGCVIEDDCMIGIGAIVLNGAVVGRGSIVASGCLVPEGAQVPPHSVVMGVPGAVRRMVSEQERRRFARTVANYGRYGRIYRKEETA